MHDEIANYNYKADELMAVLAISSAYTLHNEVVMARLLNVFQNKPS